MALRIEVIGDRGQLARSPEQALERLVDIAVADGADRDDWLGKALGSRGSSADLPVSRAPKYEIANEAQQRAVELYSFAMSLAHRAVLERLEKAAGDRSVRARHRSTTQID